VAANRWRVAAMFPVMCSHSCAWPFAARLRERDGEDSTSARHAISDEAEEYSFGVVRPPVCFDLVIERLIDR
jgi:hypothetical protein